MSETLQSTPKLINILMVEDDEGDILLTKKALTNGKIYNSLNITKDGVEAMAYLRREGDYVDAPRPDLILLDLNMPRKDGRETLAEIKHDKDLRSIPVVVFTTSDADHDILKSYDLQASCFITKPVDADKFIKVVKAIKEFWVSIVKLPPH